MADLNQLDLQLNKQQRIDGPKEEDHDSSFEAANQEVEKNETLPKPPALDELSFDSGSRAWLQVVGGFFILFNTWGIMNGFGVYQTYYESGKLFNASSSDISWIGALQAFCLLFIGFITGPVFDRGYLRSLLVIGTFCIVFGHMMLSLCHTLWQVVLAQGLLIGLGQGCLFVPAVAIFPTYFKAKLGLVLGLAASGSSLGGVIYPIMFYRLINEVGFQWAVRILGFTSLATLVVPVVVMKQRFKPAKARSLIDMAIFTDLQYMLCVFGIFLGFNGLYVALFFISFYGESQGITDSSLSFYIIPILSAASVFGRTLPNWISDKTGPFNIVIPGALMCGILLFCMLSVHTVGGIVVIALLFGFFSGIFIALPPVILVLLTKDKSKIGTWVGIGFGIMSLAVFTGGPGSGGILGNQVDLNWNGVWIYGGVSYLAAAVIFSILRVMRVGWKLNVKV